MITRIARSQRPSREPAPPLLEVLDDMHKRLLQALADLQQLVGRIEPYGGDAAARNQAGALRDFFNGNAREHHQTEEAEIFPVLLAGGDVEIVGRLQQDHGWLELDWSEIEPMLDAFAEGIGADLESLRAAVEIYAELYRDHISFEENVAYARARQLKQY